MKCLKRLFWTLQALKQVSGVVIAIFLVFTLIPCYLFSIHSEQNQRRQWHGNIEVPSRSIFINRTNIINSINKNWLVFTFKIFHLVWLSPSSFHLVWADPSNLLLQYIGLTGLTEDKTLYSMKKHTQQLISVFLSYDAKTCCSGRSCCSIFQYVIYWCLFARRYHYLLLPSPNIHLSNH